jgi:hypothetical protein
MPVTYDDAWARSGGGAHRTDNHFGFFKGVDLAAP